MGFRCICYICMWAGELTLAEATESYQYGGQMNGPGPYLTLESNYNIGICKLP